MSNFFAKIGHAILGFLLAFFFVSPTPPVSVVIPSIATSTVEISTPAQVAAVIKPEVPSVSTLTVSASSTEVSVPPVPPASPVATSTITQISTTTVTTAPAPHPIATPPIEPAVLATVPVQATTTIAGVDGEGALVNIYCLTNPSTGISSITGSGAIINTSGVVITSAHIAQYFLLEEALGQQSVNCILRTGSPAVPALNARLLYISPEWIAYNSVPSLVDSDPQGTGEDDFALLLITTKISSANTVYGYMPPDPALADLSSVGEAVDLYAYPTNPSGVIYSTDKLYQAADISSIAQISSFGDNDLDFLTIPSALIAVRGSSGGEVVRNNELIGLIDTVQDTAPGATSELGAITISHVNRSMLSQSGIDLLSFINTGDLAQKADQFEEYVSPSLVQLLIQSLELQGATSTANTAQ